MHRIDGSGATAENLFTEGDPSGGVPATTVTDYWLNAVQEEVAGVVEEAGLTLDKEDNTQLLAAIQVLAGIATGWTTGDAKLTLKTTADAGWIMANDGTIGDASSGASTRANADCAALFALLWNNLPDAVAPVTGGRGASAVADWDAHKRIQVGTIVGRALAAAGSGSGLTARSLGDIVGEETHLLTVDEMPAHTHTVAQASDFTTAGATASMDNGQDTPESTINTGSAGGDQAHNNMQPTTFLCVMIKL